MQHNFTLIAKFATLLLFSFMIATQSFSQCSVSLGPNLTVCQGEEITLTANASGGSGGYTYFWNISFGIGPSQTITPVSNSNQNLTHTYTVTVLDGAGCVTSDDIQVTVLSQPTVTVTLTQPTCTVQSMVTFNFSNHPSRSMIEFSLNGGSSYETAVPDNSSSVSYPIASGTHNLYARWGNNQCPLDLGNFIINTGPAPSINAGVNFNACDGDQVTFAPSVTGGTAPYQYSWDNGISSGNGLTTTLVGNPSANQYQGFTIAVTDVNGCSSYDIVRLNVRSRPSASVVKVDKDCFTQGALTFAFTNHPNRTGIEFSVNGGVSYLSGVPDNSSSVTYNLPPGSYHCYTRWGDNSCPVDLGVVEILNNGGVEIDLGADLSECDGQTVTLNPTITGGSGTLSYSWVSGSESGTGLDILLNGNPNGNTSKNYTVTVTDGSGCFASDVIRIVIESAPTATFVSADNSCFVDGGVTFNFPNHPNRTGIEFSINGGTSYFSSVADNSGSIFYSLNGGAYHAFVRWGNNECPVDLGTFTVITNPGAVSLEVGLNTWSCDGQLVTISPTVTGGQAPYTYTWSNGTESGNGLSFTTNGNPNFNVNVDYTITVTDDNGCVSSDSKRYSVRSLPTVTNVLTQDGCGNNAEVTFEFSNHIHRTAIEFSLNNGASYQPQVNDNSGSVTYNLSAGTHNFSSRWGNNQCPIDLGTYVINETTIDLEVGSDQEICDGESITLAPMVTGGQSPYSYVWDNGTINGTGLIFTPVGNPAMNINESYTIDVTDANGCQVSDGLGVNVRSVPSATVHSSLTGCGGGGNVVFTFSDHPDNTALQFSLNAGVSYEPIVLDNSMTVSYPIAAGNYTTYARWSDSSCPTNTGIIELIDADVFYSTGSGFASDPIWRPQGGTQPIAIDFCHDRSLVIESGHTIMADRDILAENIDIEVGGSIDVSTTNYTTDFHGNFTCNGGFSANQSAFRLTGSSIQLIQGSEVVVHDLDLLNSAGVNLLTSMKVNGAVHPEVGVFNTNGNEFTLVSEIVGTEILTGSISEIKPGADFIGDIKIQRYVESLEDGYRLIGIPIKNQTINDFQGDFVTTGYPGSDWPSHYFTNVKYYDETSHAPDDIDAGFTDVLNATNAVNEDKGYWAYFPSSSAINLLESEGEFRKGDVTFNLSYTETGDDAYEGWHCIPNPYPSAIDIESSAIDFVNVGEAIYILDHTIGGTWKGEYVVYNNGVSVNGGTNVVSSYQAFFVKANGPGASVTFKEPSKTDLQGRFYRSMEEEKSLLRFSINQDSLKYESVIAFHEDATDDFDPKFDAYKRKSVMFSMGSVCNEDVFSINTLKDYDDPIEIPIYVYAVESGEYSINLDEIQNVDPNICMTLTDLETQITHEIKEGHPVYFEILEEEYEGNRFMLSVKSAAEISVISPTCNAGSDAYVEVNPLIEGPYQFTLMNDLGETIATKEETGNTILDGIPSGVYKLYMHSDTTICGSVDFDLEIWETPLLPASSVSFLKDHCDENEGKIFISADHEAEMVIQLYLDGELVDQASGTELVVFQNLIGDRYHVEIITECGEESHEVDIENHEMLSADFELSEEEVLQEDGNLILTVESSSLNSIQENWYLDGVWNNSGSLGNFTFIESGIYEIELVSSDGYCTRELTRSIQILNAEDQLDTEVSEFALNVDHSFLYVNRLKGKNKVTRLQLFDINGKLVSSELISSARDIAWNHGELASGTYVLKLLNNDATIFRERFVK